HYQGLWKEVRYVTVLSRHMQNLASELGCPRTRVRIVHLGRHIEHIPTKTSEGPVRNFITVGRLVQKKGHLDALYAFRRVNASRPDARLDIVGDGEMRMQIERTIQKLGLQECVRLHGALPNDAT